MAIKYKMDVLAALKENGYSSFRIRQEKLIGQRTLQQIRDGIPVSWAVMEKLCQLLHCQVGDLVEYVEDDHE